MWRKGFCIHFGLNGWIDRVVINKCWAPWEYTRLLETDQLFHAMLDFLSSCVHKTSSRKCWVDSWIQKYAAQWRDQSRKYFFKITYLERTAFQAERCLGSGEPAGFTRSEPHFPNCKIRGSDPLTPPGPTSSCSWGAGRPSPADPLVSWHICGCFCFLQGRSQIL